MSREDTRERLKTYLPDYVERITEHSKGNAYVCPLCGSGTGPNGTGAFNIYDNGSGPRWHCFACDRDGDLYDLIGAVEAIEDHNEQLRRALDLFGSGAPEPRKRPVRQDPEEEPDYRDFIKEAAGHIGDTDYHRGISEDTLRRFLVGYCPAWRHPKAPHAPASPRLIIPTSWRSYLARDTRAEIPEEQQAYSKSKAGRTRIYDPGRALKKATRPVFIVEGELDALSIIDVGGEAIALGSTAMVRALLEQLKDEKPAQPLVIAMDNDDAGRKAAEKLSEGLEALGVPFYRRNPAGNFKDCNAALMADRNAFAQAVAEAEIDDATLAEMEREKDKLRKEAALYSLGDFLVEIEAARKAIPTGFKELDTLLEGGLYPGLYVVGAVTSLGKTSFCLQIADQIAQTGQPVLIFSLEMAANELIAKSISRITAQLDLKRTGGPSIAKSTRGILSGTRYSSYSAEEKKIIEDAIDQYGTYAGNLWIVQGVGDVTVQTVREKVERFIATYGQVPVVLIDYLQLLASMDPRLSDKQATDKNVLELKRISRDHRLPVIAVSSFNRDNYTAPVNLAAYKESGAIEYSSDVLLGLQYTGMDYQDGEADKAREKRIRDLLKEQAEIGRNGGAQNIQVKILKHRNGARGEAPLLFRPMFNLFTGRAAEEAAGGWVPLGSARKTAPKNPDPAESQPWDGWSDELDEYRQEDQLSF